MPAIAQHVATIQDITVRRTLETALETAKLQLSSPRQSRSIVREAVATVRDILVETASGVSAAKLTALTILGG